MPLTLTLTLTLAFQAPAGYWAGEMVREGARLPVSFRFERIRDTLRAFWDAPSMRALGVPLSDLDVSGDRIGFALVGDQSSTRFTGAMRGDSLVGSFSGGEGEGTFRAVHRPPPAPAYREREVTFPNGGVRLAGTLFTPRVPGRHPAVLFMHGSGPEGRFGSRYLATELASRGIVTLIYDKRGVGTSTGDWRYATLDSLAADAAAGVLFLRGQASVAPHEVGTYGHSQGGLVTAVLLSRTPGIAYSVAAASYGGIAYEQDLSRVEGAIRRSSFASSEQDEAVLVYRRFVEVIRTGIGIPEFTRDLGKVADRPWIQFLAIPPNDHWLWKTYPAIGNFDPLPLWERIRTPVLLLYGENDQIVPVEISIRRIGAALDRAGNDSWAAAILPRAAHAFTIAPKPGEPFAWRVVAPGLADLVAGWVTTMSVRGQRR